MTRFLVWMLGTVMFCSIWLCWPADAQEVPTEAGSQSFHNTDSQRGQTQGQSQRRAKRCGEGSRNQSIPKPERNRLDEGTGKKASKPKRKKASKSASAKKGKRGRKGNALSSEDKDSALRKGHGGKKGLSVNTERVDDIPVLIRSMMRIGLQKAIDNHVCPVKNQRELSWGWTAVIWLAYILSEGDHRKVSVQEYVSGMPNTLSELTGQRIHELDFEIGRLTNLLRYLNDDEVWGRIEEELSANSIEVYELPKETVRCDATTVSGYHQISEEGIFQYGNSKDDPSLPQIKIMTGSLDPLGMALATDVVSGERADDKLYAPIISRIASVLQSSGILYVGDCKLSSLNNRLHIKGVKGHYLCPLPLTGETAKKIEDWIQEGILKDEKGELIEWKVKTERGEEELKAKGYEIERKQSGTINGKEIEWTERVLVVNSPAYATQKQKGLEKRLRNAERKIYALTPQRGRGRKQITDEEELIAAAEGIVKKHRVENFLSYGYEKEVERQTKYIGKGKPSVNKETRIIEKVRYQITHVRRNEEQIEKEIKTYGWKAYVTDVRKNRLGFVDAVKCYRNEYRVERIFNRLKSRLNIAPFHVKRDDQVKGLTHLLTLGVRIITLLEYVVRRSLQNNNEELVGLHPGNRKKATDIPTTEKLLKAFSKITLTIIQTGDNTLRHLTPLSELQISILKHLGLDPSIYTRLEIGQTGNPLSEQ